MPDERRSWSESLLFSPLHVRSVRFRNRIVLPPMKTNMDLTDRQAVAYYRARSAGGAGLVIVEATPLEQFDDPRFGDSLRRLADAVHAGGATAAIQLIQFGRLNGERVEPSATEDARAATTEEIKEIVGRFAAAAAMACDAGFDAAEIHGAHDFLLNRFFSPQLNRRTDGYGGTLERRMRFGLEVVGAVRSECGEGFLVLYRHTTINRYRPHVRTLTIKPAVASIFFLSTHRAIKLTTRETSGPNSTSTPARSASGEPHPGLSTNIKATVSHGSKDRQTPTLPIAMSLFIL